MDLPTAAALTVITAATPLLFAALGELVAEKSGVLNLGVEGMILLGAVSGFAAVVFTGSAAAGVAAGALGGAALAAVFALLALGLQASQVATGLALTIFGVGLSALLGQDLVGVAYDGLPKLPVPVFAAWRPWRAFVGAYLFGGITILQLHAQAAGVGLPSQVMSMLPYLATIAVLVLISRDPGKIKLDAPTSIGRAFHPST